MNKKALYIALGVVVLLGITSFFVIKKKKSKFDVLLLGGLDTRPNDLNIKKQAELLQKGLGEKNKVKAFRYNDSDGLINQMQSNKNVKIVLFSRGCDFALEIIKGMEQKNINLNRLYIVEPYAPSSNTTKVVRKAVSKGVPSKNVIVGKTANVGKGIVENTTNTPSCSPYHWCALEMVGKIITK